MGSTPPLAASARLGCYWTEDGGLRLMVAAYTPMAMEVEERLRNANSRGTDVLAYLTWLRIDGHYALERVLATHPRVVLLAVGRRQRTTGGLRGHHADRRASKAIPADLRTGVEDFCPLGRKVACGLLHYFDRRPAGGRPPA